MISENLDVGSYSEAEFIGKIEDPLAIPRAHLIRTTFSTEDSEQGFFKSMVKTLPTLQQFGKHLGVMSSGVINADYPRRISLGRIYEFSKDAEVFINSQKQSHRYREEIVAISDRAFDFLEEQGIAAKIFIPLFADPEYTDWLELKIRIEVPKDELKKAYELYNDLLSYSLKGIRRKTLKKIFVAIESDR